MPRRTGYEAATPVSEVKPPPPGPGPGARAFVLPEPPPPPPYHARCVALEAASRVYQRAAGGQAGYVQAASSQHVLAAAQEYYEWLMESTDAE